MPRIAFPIQEGKGENYLNALKNLGAEPVSLQEACGAEGFDGLLLPGGGDVATWRYREEPCGAGEADEWLDDLQFSLLDAFVKAGKPVLGICRGHQLINVYFGGSLIQHLPTAESHTTPGKDQVHMTRAAEGSWVQRLYGKTVFAANSSHHQAVKTLGDGLVADQWAEDGTVEAMHHLHLPIWSVQWHPERMCFALRREDTVDGAPVIAHFLAACR